MSHLINEREIDDFFDFCKREAPLLLQQRKVRERCSRCILSSVFSPIVDGLCTECRAHQAQGTPERQGASSRALEDLDLLMRQAQGKGGWRYDALLLLSGGKDSVYLLDELTTKYPRLRILCVMVDNGFASRIALSNAQFAAERCGSDFICFRPAPELFSKAFRFALTASDKGNGYETVDRLDGDLTFDTGRHYARMFHIPLMIAGLSPAQLREIFGTSEFESDPVLEQSGRKVSAGVLLSQLFDEHERRAFWDGAEKGRPVPRVIFPFAAWPYDESEIRRAVVARALMRNGEQDPLRTNNDLIPLILAKDIAQRGFSGFEPEFARLVRQGIAEREHWLHFFVGLEFLVPQGLFMPKSICAVLEKLKLSADAVALRPYCS